jgi:hypothetical protein
VGKAASSPGKVACPHRCPKAHNCPFPSTWCWPSCWLILWVGVKTVRWGSWGGIHAKGEARVQVPEGRLSGDKSQRRPRTEGWTGGPKRRNQHRKESQQRLGPRGGVWGGSDQSFLSQCPVVATSQSAGVPSCPLASQRPTSTASIACGRSRSPKALESR